MPTPSSAPIPDCRPKKRSLSFRRAAELFSGSKDLKRALLSPAVSKPRKTAIVTRLIDELGLHRLMRNFFLVVVNHRRIHELEAIRRAFEVEVDERLGWIPAEITSASELTQEQRQEVERSLGTKLGKFIRAQYQVDPALLAGVRARVGSKEYDATLRGKLEHMRQQLAHS